MPLQYDLHHLSRGRAGDPYAGAVIVLTRFVVDLAATETFVAQAETAVAVLAARDGFVSVDFGRNLDDPTLWTITTRWLNVGSYRRALQGYESKLAVVPLLSQAVDEPSAYDDADLVGENRARGS
ncbi:MAG: antibiotic biosynthesis monooxygenase [Friedmanniella sp.]|nr:antibiotic biosynthesis monooxygenase [Friedmanniella sp.]